MIEKFQQKKHQVAQRKEVQQRQVVQHWRVSLETLLEFVNATYSNIFFSAGRAQPDNREGDENCLAVLNNFYDDGIR